MKPPKDGLESLTILEFVGLAELRVGQAGRIQDIHINVISFTSHDDLLVIDGDKNQNEYVKN